MTSTELFEERAERGAPRGAAKVWAGAQHELRDAAKVATRGSALALRAALLLAAVGLLALVATQPGPFDDSNTVRVATPAEEGEVMANLPAPILVNGMKLDEAMKPWGNEQRESFTFSTDGSPTVVSTRVYARSSEPFTGPVVGIDTLEGGGFSPWAANVSADELLELTNSVSRDGSDWVLSEVNGLTEVAQFREVHISMVTNGWQFDFVDGSKTATVQSEPDETGWLWVSRVLRSAAPDEQPVMTPIEVLGLDAVLIDDEALWDVDGFVYRLTAGEVRGDTHYGRPVEPVVDQLTLVDQAEWDAAVEQAGRLSPWETGAAVAAAASFVAWLLASAWLAIRQPRRLVPIAGIGLVGVAVWWTVASSVWFTLALVALMFGALVALLRARPGDQQVPAPPQVGAAGDIS